MTSQEILDALRGSVPDGAPDTAFYSGRTMSASGSEAYSLALTPGAMEKKLYADPLPGSLADVSRDGKRGLWVSFPSEKDNTVFVLDLASGDEAGWRAAELRCDACGAHYTPTSDGYLADGDGKTSTLAQLGRPLFARAGADLPLRCRALGFHEADEERLRPDAWCDACEARGGAAGSPRTCPPPSRSRPRPLRPRRSRPPGPRLGPRGPRTRW